MALSLTIPRCTVLEVLDQVSQKGNAYKQVLLHIPGAKSTPKLFFSKDATLPPLGQPLTVQLDVEVGYEGDFRINWNKDTKFKAL